MKRDDTPAASAAPSRQPKADPLKPRPRMLLVLSVVFVLWVAFLLTMYFTTVYPNRYIEVQPDETAAGRFAIPAAASA